MGFKEKSFGSSVYNEETVEPKKAMILSCEGNNTEPEYFEALKEELKEHIPVLLEIEIVPKNGSGSQPKFIVENMDRYIEQYDLKEDYDEMWIVIDRESDEPHRKGLIEEIIPQCNEKKYQIAITNPLFEFWLLLHVDDISNHNKQNLFENKWETEAKNRRYIDKQLSEILSGFNKKAGKFPKKMITIENVKRAIAQEKQFKNNIEDILDDLGSNIGSLIQKIVKLD